MTAGGRTPEPPPPRGPGGNGENAGWSAFSYLISGMAVYGGIGWLIGRWTGISMLFPLGALVGLGLGVLLVIYRYGRP